MQYASKITTIGLGIAVMVGLSQAANVPILELKADHTILAGAANVLLVYFVLALLIERGCEVAMDLLTALGLVPPKTPTDNGPQPKERTLTAVLLCLAFSMAISLTGMRLVEMVLNTALKTAFVSTGKFAYADTLLTSFILAGGSEGIHRIIKRLLGDKSEIPATT